MDDDAVRALCGEVRGMIDDWAVFAPVETDDGTLWRGIRAWPWRPGEEAWLLVRDGRWRGLRPVSGVPFMAFLEALDGGPVPDEVIETLFFRRDGDADWTFVGFDGQIWVGTEPASHQAGFPWTDHPTPWQLVRDRHAEDAPALTDLLAGLWPDEAREAALRREELELLPSTILRRWTTVDILGDRARTGADRRVRRGISLRPVRKVNRRGGLTSAFWTAYRVLRPAGILEVLGWPPPRSTK